MKTYNNASSAYVLPIVLFMVIILISGGVFALHIAKQKIQNTSLLLDAIQARVQAESQLELIKFYATTGEFSSAGIKNIFLKETDPAYPAYLYIDNREHNITSDITIKLQDTAGLLNIATPNVKILSELLHQTKKDTDAQTFSDTILDWMDEDDFHRLNGAESDYYKQKNFAYAPRNIPYFQAPQELRLLKGVNELQEKQWSELEKYLIFVPYGGINLATTPVQLLSAYLDIDEKLLDGLEELRKKDFHDFATQIRHFPAYDIDTFGFFPSKILKVEITVKQNSSQAHISTMLDFKTYTNAPMHTINFK